MKFKTVSKQDAKFKVSLGLRRWAYFDDIDEASRCADYILKRSGVAVAVVSC